MSLKMPDLDLFQILIFALLTYIWCNTDVKAKDKFYPSITAANEAVPKQIWLSPDSQDRGFELKWLHGCSL